MQPPKNINSILQKININDLYAEKCRRSFYFFVQYFWDTIIAEKPIWNWHIKYICDELQQVGERVAKREKKEYDYYIINVPPGSSKSTIVSEMYPLWCWVIDPTQQFLCGSYSNTLADELSEKCFNIFTSEKFKKTFPHLVKNISGGKTAFNNGLGGWRKTATPYGGTGTGFHGHQKIYDDIMSRDTASSEVERNKTNTWMTETMTLRNIDNEVTVTILMMQRLHMMDSTGYLLSRKNIKIKHICIPAELTDDVKPKELANFYIDGCFDIHRKGPSVLASMKEDLGSYGYAGQMLQRPSPADGGLIKKEWFQIIKQHSLPPNMIVNFQLDTAYTDKQINDPSAVIAYAKAVNLIYILNVISVHKEFPDLIKWLKEHTFEYGYEERSRIWVEPKATGKTIVQQLKRNTNLNMIESEPPKTDKISRVRGCSAKLESGKVILLEGHWNESFLNQLASFPNGRHDDEVDCLTAIIERELIKQQSYGQYNFL